MISIRLTSILYFILFILSHSEGKEVEVTHKVIYDIRIGEKNVGSIVLGLFGKVAPKTVANIVAFSDTKGFNGLSYRGVKFHRVVPGFVVQVSNKQFINFYQSIAKNLT
jgi:hypothetical protein